LALIGAPVLTPLFVWYVREEGDAWVINAFVSTIALPFWAYAIGASAFAGYRDGNLAAILVVTFSVISAAGPGAEAGSEADAQGGAAAARDQFGGGRHPRHPDQPGLTSPAARRERSHPLTVRPYNRADVRARHSGVRFRPRRPHGFS
jgi:hypothetical protein